MPLIFIGMPVYNGARYLSTALDSIKNQTFTDWTLLISDNASEDETESICKEYSFKDARIKYVRQKQNIGAISNFKFVLDEANSKYFMWASHDDVWLPEFLEACIGLLERNKNYGMAFCNIENIDSYGRVTRRYLDFFRYAKNSHFINICNYVFIPGIMGKANFLYSVYRLEICKVAWKACPLTVHYAVDVCFNLAALARGNILVDNRILFQKRIPKSTDNPSKIQAITVGNPYLKIFPIKGTYQHFRDHIRAVRNTRFLLITLIIMSIVFLMTGIATFINFLLRIEKR